MDSSIPATSRHMLNTFIHFMTASAHKGPQRSAIKEFLADACRDARRWCAFTHGKKIAVGCYLTSPSTTELLAVLEKYILCSKFLFSNRYFVDQMQDTVDLLRDPQEVETYKNFARLLSGITDMIDLVDPEIREKIVRLTCDECERMDEAIVSYENYCFRASTVMAVSAVEFRPHYLIRITDKKLYKSEFEKATLGQLIQVFDENGYKEARYKRIKRLMPDRHRPLVGLLNQYRILSAHPKEIDVTAQIAESILSLSLEFLTDPATFRYPKSYLKHDPKEMHAMDIGLVVSLQKEENEKRKKS